MTSRCSQFAYRVHRRRYWSAILFVNLRIRRHLRPQHFIRSEKCSSLLYGQLIPICIRRRYCRHRLCVGFPPSEPEQGSDVSGDQGQDSHHHSDSYADLRPLAEATAPTRLGPRCRCRCRCRCGRRGRCCEFWVCAGVRSSAPGGCVPDADFRPLTEATAPARLGSRCGCRCICRCNCGSRCRCRCKCDCGRGGRCSDFCICAGVHAGARCGRVAHILAPNHGLGSAFDRDIKGPAHGKGRPPVDLWLAGHFKVAAEGFERIIKRKKETTGCRRCFVVHYQVRVRTRVVRSRRAWILSYVRLALGRKNRRW